MLNDIKDVILMSKWRQIPSTSRETPSQEKVKITLFWHHESQNNDFWLKKIWLFIDGK